MEIILFIVGGLILLAVIGVALQPPSNLNKDIPPFTGFKKRTKVLYQEDENFEVGKVWLEYTFDNKKKFVSVVYGEAHTLHQWFDAGRDASVYHGEVKEPEAGLVTPLLAKNKALAMLRHNTEHTTVVDDEKNPTESYSGKIVSVKFLEEEPHTETQMIYKVKNK